MSLAPIILFVYKRPDLTQKVLKALQGNILASESILYIYSDAPKSNSDAKTQQDIEQTRGVIKSQKWCKEVNIVERAENCGLERSVIEGVTEIIDRYGKAIVLEDDIITSKYFLQYMNDALDVYQDEQKVISIGALNFFATDNKVGDTFFIPIPDCWGWATWKNRWKLFEPNAQLLLNRLRENDLIRKFNLNGAYDFESMLIDQIKGSISSWAIRWQAVAYLENKLSLYPRNSVTKNIGFGGGSTHGGNDAFSSHIRFAEERVSVKKMPVEEDSSIIKKMEKGYWESTQPAPMVKTKLKIRSHIKSLIPPIIPIVYRKMRPHKNTSILWEGDFKNWDEAKQQCVGYENPVILEKTKNAILKVKKGEAAAERDSVLFDRAQHNWPLVSSLLRIAIENNQQINLIDFGGSLGSTYFQNKTMIPDEIKLSWNIVEQKSYVDVGNREIKDENLSFYYSIDDAFKQTGANVILLGSVLPYLEKPYELIDEIMTYGFKYIIVDKTGFTDDPEDRITIQTVPDSIYRSTYPAWFFNNTRFKKYFSEKYTNLLEFESDNIGNINLEGKSTVYWRGYLFKIKSA